jgi:hypothetical protein
VVDTQNSQKSYPVQLKLKTGTPDSNPNGLYKIEGVLDTEKSLVFDFQIFNKRGFFSGIYQSRSSA